MTFKDINFRQILSSIQKGDVQAFRKLFYHFYPLLFDYGIKLYPDAATIEDSLQDIFLSLWQNRASITTIQSLHAYLITSLRRNILRKRKLHRNNRVGDAAEFFSIPDDAFNAEQLMIHQELQERRRVKLREAFQQLSPKVREVIYLKTFQGLRYQEISQILGIRPQVARNYVWEGIKQLRKILKHESELG